MEQKSISVFQSCISKAHFEYTKLLAKLGTLINEEKEPKFISRNRRKKHKGKSCGDQIKLTRYVILSSYKYR